MRKLFTALPVVALLAVGACVENYYELRDATPSNEGYTQVLADAYLAQATKKYKTYDYRVTEFLSEKGLRAAGGEHVFADSIASWNVPAGTIQELAEARQMLREAYNAGLQNQYPDLVASAQVSFDTWMAELYYDNGLDAADARQQMVDAMAQLAIHTMKPEEKMSIMAQASGQQIMTPSEEQEIYEDYNKEAPSDAEAFVFFPNNSAKLSPDDVIVIKQMAHAISQSDYDAVSLFGYASNVGDPAYNLRLSHQRAEAVKKALVEALGEDADDVTITAVGQGSTAPSDLPAEYQRAVVIKTM